MNTLNQLEQSLRHATLEPGARPSLYKQLLQSEAFVLIVAPPGAVATIFNSNIAAWIRSDGVHVIPCFTTLEKARDAAHEGQLISKVWIRSLMEANRDSHFHVNPNSEFDLQLSSEDVASLLERGTINMGVARAVIGNEVCLRTPMEDVSASVAALAHMFERVSHVERAYVCEMEQPSSGYRSITVAIVSAISDKSLVHAIATVMLDTYEGSLPVDVCVFNCNDAEDRALGQANVAPFYKRRAKPGEK